MSSDATLQYASPHDTEPRWSELVDRRGAIQIATLTLLISVLFYDQIWRMISIWRTEMDWSHGFLIFPFSLYLIHSRRSELRTLRMRPSWLGLALIVAAVAGYMFSIWAKIGYPQQLALVIVIAGTVLLMGGWSLLRYSAAPIAFLVLALPPPDYLYKKITQPLQGLAAWVSQAVLSMLPDVTIVRNGFFLTAFDGVGTEIAQFHVQGACSGMRSLLAFTALGMALAFITPRPVWQRIAMGVVVVPVALFCNAIRVVVTGTLLIYKLEDYAKGTYHTLLGLVTFALGVMIYSMVLYVMDHLIVDDHADSDNDNAGDAGSQVAPS